MNEENTQIEESQIPNTAEEADALLEKVEQEAGPKEASSQDEAEAKAQAIKEIREYEFEAQPGKKIKAPIEKILTWAKHGYGATNTINQLRAQLEQYSQKEQKIKEYEEKYGPVDEYVRQNPQFWEHVQNSWQQAQQAKSQNVNPEIAQLMNTVKELQSYKDQIEQERQQIRVQKEDAAYMETLSDIKKQYPRIDFDAPDENGQSLEWKVLKHAQENGIKNFKTAFRDFYHDELVKLEAEKAKEKVIADKQSQTKLGILGESKVPTSRRSDSIKGKSYNDITKDILQELNLA